MTVSETRIELSNLQDQYVDLERRLETAIEEEDVDPSVLMNFKKELQINATKQYAARARILRLSKNEHQQDRERAITERDQLEEDLKRTALFYDHKLREAEDARVAYQTICIKLGALDSRIETDRQAINERQVELAQHISRWKQDAYSHLTRENVCD